MCYAYNENISSSASAIIINRDLIVNDCASQYLFWMLRKFHIISTAVLHGVSVFFFFLPLQETWDLMKLTSCSGMTSLHARRRCFVDVCCFWEEWVYPMSNGCRDEGPECSSKRMRPFTLHCWFSSSLNAAESGCSTLAHIRRVRWPWVTCSSLCLQGIVSHVRAVWPLPVLSMVLFPTSLPIAM